MAHASGRSVMSVLSRLCATGPTGESDEDVIRHFPVNQRSRREENILRNRVIDEETVMDRIMESAAHPRHEQSFSSISSGLMQCGWAETPNGVITVGSGSYGEVLLAFKLEDQRRGIRLESRHLSAVKVQPQRKHYFSLDAEVQQQIWNEVDILRGVVHENVVDYYGHFVVKTEEQKVHIVILLEYASAGDLEKEVTRYRGKVMNEPAARYYVRQVSSGITYLHGKYISHNDLYPRNILLKYNPNGSKTCMLCDFGVSSIFDPGNNDEQGDRDAAFASDIAHIPGIVFFLLCRERQEKAQFLSKDAHEVIKFCMDPPDDQPTTVTQLFREYKWFTSGKVTAPFPKPPSPLLEQQRIADMGYRQPSHPAQGWSRTDRIRRRISSLPQEISRKIAGKAEPVSDSVSENGSNSSWQPAAGPVQGGLRRDVDWGEGGQEARPYSPRSWSSSSRSFHSDRSDSHASRHSTPRTAREHLKAAARHAVASDLKESRSSGRQGRTFGGVIRRSLSSMGESVIGCFRRRNRSPAGESGSCRNRSPSANS